MSGEFASAGSIKATIDFDSAGLAREINKAMEKATTVVADQIDQSMTEVEGRISSGFKKAGAGLLGALGIGSVSDALADAGRRVFAVGMEGERALNMFGAVSGATADQMREVGDAAQALGSDASLAGVSAGDAALAMTELAKSGFSVEESMAGAEGVLQLATAAQTDAATAATIAASQIQAFGLAASDSAMVADLLANAANMTAADMGGMSDALNQVGAVANASGLSLAETAGTVAMMADNAIVGSDAGTSLKAMLIALQAPSGEAQRIMSKLGINVYDNAGNMKDLAGITAEVTEGTANLTQRQRDMALATIFGSDAIRAVNVLMAEGADGMRDLSEAIQEEGAAAKLADANTKGFVGAVGAITNTVEGVAFSLYRELAPALEDATRDLNESLPDAIDEATDYLGELIDNLEPAADLFVLLFEAIKPAVILTFKAALAAVLGVTETLSVVLGPLVDLIEANEDAFKGVVTAIAAVVLGYKAMKLANSVWSQSVGGAVGTARRHFRELRTEVSKSVAIMSSVRGAGRNLFSAMGGPWGLAIAGAVLAFGKYAQAQADAKAHVEELTESLDEQTGALTENSREAIISSLENNGILKAAEDAGIGLHTLTEAIMGNSTAMGVVRDRLAEVREEIGGAASAAGSAISGATAQDFQNQLDSIDKIEGAIGGEVDAIEESTDAWRRRNEAAMDLDFSGIETTLGAGHEIWKRASDAAGDYSKHVVGGMNEIDDAATDAKAAVEALNNEFVTGLSEEVQFEQAIDDAAAAIKEIGENALTASGQFNLNRQAGRDLATALSGVAVESDGVAGGTKRARTQIVQMLTPLLNSKTKARELADQFFQTGDSAVGMGNDVQGAGNKAKDASGKIDGLRESAKKADGMSVEIEVDTPGLATSLSSINNFISRANTANGMSVSVPFVSRGGMIRRAGGGPVYGGGTGTSDDVEMLASDGEHVITAEEVRAAGGHQAVYRWRQAMLAGGFTAADIASEKGGPLVGSLDISVGDRRDLPDALDETMFRLRTIRRGSHTRR